MIYCATCSLDEVLPHLIFSCVLTIEILKMYILNMIEESRESLSSEAFLPIGEVEMDSRDETASDQELFTVISTT